MTKTIATSCTSLADAPKIETELWKFNFVTGRLDGVADFYIETLCSNDRASLIIK